MKPELRKLVVNQFTGWAENWGLALSYAVTQSVEKAERILADATVALVTSETERAPLQSATAPRTTQLPASVNAVRFAAVIWEMANAQAYRGFGTDSFFRMPAVARAIVVLKTKALFSRVQIAAVLNLKIFQVDDHLENARLLFSDGRPWLQGSPGLTVQGDRWVPECPQWSATAPRADSVDTGMDDIQQVFANYIGNDLDSEASRTLHAHLIVCTDCRSNFSHFKKQYADWSAAVPTVEADPLLRKSLTKMTKMAIRVKRRGPPSPWPGLRRLWRDNQVRALLLGAMSVLFLQYILQHRK